MRKLFLLLLFAIPSMVAAAQEPQADAKKTVEEVTVEGVNVEQRLSAGLREELQKLVGQPYDAQAADQFADRIQSELPDFIAASRVLPGSQPDRVRLVFAVARITDRGANINARYTVESVEVEGVPRSQLSVGLYADMQQMVGNPLNDAQADQLRDRLAAELGTRYGVDRQVARGTPQHLRVFYYAYKLPWLPFRDPQSFLAYHQKQGISFSLIVPINLDDEFSFTPPEPPEPQTKPGSTVGGVRLPSIKFNRKGGSTKRVILGVANSADELLERYKGFRFGYEQVSVGTERLGIKLEYSTFGVRWQPETVRVSQAFLQPEFSDLYRSRRSLEPSVAFAFSRSLYATAGVQFVDLEMQSPATGSRSANAGVGSLRFRHTFKSGEISHEVNAGYDAHAGSRTLDSDYVYTRHLWDGRYTFSQDKNRVTIAMFGGRIIGNAPLFDRFSLGNTETLRGWNKFDLAALGGSRVVHGSLQYGRSDDFHVFYDAGAVWNRGDPIRVRSAIGIGFGSTEDTNLTLGFRIRGAHLSPNIMFKVRF